MTIKSLAIIIALCSGSLYLSAQDQLIIKDTQKSRIRVFKPGNNFLFIASGDSVFHRGKIEKIESSSVTLLLVDEEEPETVSIPLRDLQVIRKASKAQYVSYALGALFMINGAYFILEGPNVGASHWTGRGLGVVSFALGLMPFMRTPKTYDIGERYIIETKILDNILTDPDQ